MGKRVFKIAGLCLQLNLITLIVVLHHITNMAFYQRIARLEAGSGGHLRARAEFGLGPWWPYQDGWDDTCSSVQLITDLVYLGISSNIIHEHWGSIPSSDHPMFNRQSHQGINISPSFFSTALLSGARWVQMSPNAAKVFEWHLSLKSRFAGCVFWFCDQTTQKFSEHLPGFLWFLLFLALITSRGRVDLVISTGWSGSDKQTQSDHLECDGRYHGRPWAESWTALNYWWNRAQRWTDTPSQAHIQKCYFLGDPPLWLVLLKPASCRNSAIILVNVVTRV